MNNVNIIISRFNENLEWLNEYPFNKFKWYKYFLGNTPAKWSTWWGIFSIDKRDIIQHPITRYKILIETVNKHSNPEAGHYMEGSWGAIFFPLFHTKKICC